MIRALAIIVFGIYALAILALVIAHFMGPDTTGPRGAGPPNDTPAPHVEQDEGTEAQ